MDDVLIIFGSEVKADGNGHFTGRLVRLTDAENKDRAGDYFTKATDFGIKSGATTPVWFNHRMPLVTRDGKEVVVKSKIGEATLTLDDDGVLIDAIIYNREKHEKAIVKAGKGKKLSWSSGTAPHLVDRDDDGHIRTWPLGTDASLTPIPCEPQNDAVCAKQYAELKFADIDELEEAEAKPEPQPRRVSLAAKLNQLIEDRVDDGLSRDDFVKRIAREAAVGIEIVEAVLKGETPRPPDAHLKAVARVLSVSFESLREAAHGFPQTIKGMFEEALAESTPTRWELESVYCRIIRKLANAASASKLAGVEFDLEAKVKEATEEYTALLMKHALGQIETWLEEGGDEEFYLKAIVDLSNDLPVSGHLDLEDHSLLAVSAVREVAKRFRANHEARTKSGRVLSEKNRLRISERLKEMQAVMDDLAGLLEESTPMASDSEKRAALSYFLRQQQRARQLGVTHG